ncbi:hypothetical protein M5C72_10945 [Companilactobacillus allii]|uniref:Uncharacterized protein n=1 Tax=Companilactobacillus allii TaxID=1847728 RepID=A0A1P8Q065_9LACO|nr:hypothetical protein [Companilactobacillus allii]APX71272.1 hypothetical protein BTM29_01315 [Companilactobacillus allii]USQ68354.1 hypothetical protein M5C72_10945 [Companilactobacillus allii]
MSIKFGKKINYYPLLITLVISIFVGYLISITSNELKLGIIFGLVCLIVILSIFTVNIDGNHSYWLVTEKGIYYYDYSKFTKRVAAILFPSFTNRLLITFTEINSISLVVGEGMSVPKGIGSEGAVDASFYVVGSALGLFSKGYYLKILLKDDKEVDLPFTSNDVDMRNIGQVVSEIEKQTNKKVTVLRLKSKN